MGMKLFAVYLGGRAKGCNVELHDVVFVTGTSIENTYPKLKKKWFGAPKIPHIDSYIELSRCDGFAINLVKAKPQEDSYKLYFVNFGAYTENLFGELHHSSFYVSRSRSEATAKARKELCVGLIETHLDNHIEIEEHLQKEGQIEEHLHNQGLFEFDRYDVDDLLEVEDVDGYYLEFTPIDLKTLPPAHPGYKKLVKEAVPV